MTLRDLKLAVSYSSAGGSLVKCFYEPCLSRARLYRRAVGYFTSHGLAHAATGMAAMLESGGRIQLIASPCLTDDDIASINNGYKSRTEIFRDRAASSFDEIHNRLVSNRLGALSWLISEGLMDVKLAIRVDASGRVRRGIFHEKMGIISDEEGHHVAFSGSANETEGGLVENFETIDVYWSWDDPQTRVQEKIDRFEALWDNKTKGLVVDPFTDVAQEVLRPYKPRSRPIAGVEDVGDDYGAELPVEKKLPRVPPDVTLRDYQEEIIRNWFRANGQGVFRMATGTGKTITALAAVTKLKDKFPLKALIVAVPYRHLVDQWAEECRKFNLDPICAYETRTTWEPRLVNELYQLGTGQEGLLVVLVTNATFGKDSFQSKLRDFPAETMFIADEVHNMGAAHLRSALPERVPFRLGLSATPERWFDDYGTKTLFDYFGPPVEPELTLKDAIDKGVLVPYRYHPVLVELTDVEHDQYVELSAKIGRAMGANNGAGEPEDNPALEALLIKRARLLASASNKLQALKDIMQGRLRDKFMLVYCGDGRVSDDKTSEPEARQIEAVTSLLGRELGITASTYTAETPVEERRRLVKKLGSGQVQALIAIRCLDEGVDIPPVRTAFILASSTNPRQFIQRRGRVLRRSPGKDSAEIFDFIVTPPNDIVDTDVERRMLRRELVRFAEFADLAMNAGVARQKIFELQKRYDLLDI